ncbi:MAG: hypothetical protein MUO26_15610 [Methanotrichaceae archaeon]|nr:hypothetical protein [Methanotrichaceae archaeon]
MNAQEKRVTNQEDKPQKQKNCGCGSITKCEKCGSSNTSIIQIEEDGYISQMIWCKDCARREFGERKFDNEGYG